MDTGDIRGGRSDWSQVGRSGNHERSDSVLIDGASLEVEFGANEKDWAWQAVIQEERVITREDNLLSR